FADGGLSALGVNVILMALVTGFVGYGAFRLMLRVLPKTRAMVSGAAFAAGLVSVPGSALGSGVLSARGWIASVSPSTACRAMVAGAAFAAALVSVPASALAFVVLYALGGTADVSLGTVAGAMVGVHVLIGIGEALITAVTVSSVLAVRPDLVYGARDLMKRPELRTAAPSASQA